MCTVCSTEFGTKHIYSKLPYDLILHIISFVEDVDIRRYFGIYEKLDMKKYETLNYITLKPGKHPFNSDIIRYNMKNLYCIDRNISSINYNENDMIDFVIKIKPKEVITIMGIYRVKKITDKIMKNDIYKVDDEFYWEQYNSAYIRK